ncbi:hypothetical protein BZG82_13130 [Salinivibrio sp. PR5]|nr:hypothetical protein BZG82_13130 [Salinivibrio sp. PR5]
MIDTQKAAYWQLFLFAACGHAFTVSGRIDTCGYAQGGSQASHGLSSAMWAAGLINTINEYFR